MDDEAGGLHSLENLMGGLKNHDSGVGSISSQLDLNLECEEKDLVVIVRVGTKDLAVGIYFYILQEEVKIINTCVERSWGRIRNGKESASRSGAMVFSCGVNDDPAKHNVLELACHYGADSVHPTCPSLPGGVQSGSLWDLIRPVKGDETITLKSHEATDFLRTPLTRNRRHIKWYQQNPDFQAYYKYYQKIGHNEGLYEIDRIRLTYLQMRHLENVYGKNAPYYQYTIGLPPILGTVKGVSTPSCDPKTDKNCKSQPPAPKVPVPKSPVAPVKAQHQGQPQLSCNPHDPSCLLQYFYSFMANVQSGSDCDPKADPKCSRGARALPCDPKYDQACNPSKSMAIPYKSMHCDPMYNPNCNKEEENRENHQSTPGPSQSELPEDEGQSEEGDEIDYDPHDPGYYGYRGSYYDHNNPHGASPFVNPHGASPYGNPHGASPYGNPHEHSPYGNPHGASPYGNPHSASPYGNPHSASPYGNPHEDSPYGNPHGASPYGNPHEDSPYGNPHEDSPYGNPHGASPYGNPYGASPYGNPHEDSPYGNPYGASPYGNPHENSPYGNPHEDSPYGNPDEDSPYGNPDEDSPYGNPDEDSPYGNPDEDSPYGNPYGASPYGNPHAASPYRNPYGASPYGNPYGASPYPSPYGSPYESPYNSPYASPYDPHYGHEDEDEDEEEDEEDDEY
ncbi:actinodin3 [Carcharodon carcharias]|uniref:actinodin3 n=1 Tax=Carcharodon carcharias TaxID=13397 RepID=UPI001B7E5341|nr:actinodin3 [Carcharodon carcharias]